MSKPRVLALMNPAVPLRRRAYREIIAIFREHLPWIPVIQPLEAYGMQRYVDWEPYPNAQIEIRSLNLRLRRP